MKLNKLTHGLLATLALGCANPVQTQAQTVDADIAKMVPQAVRETGVLKIGGPTAIPPYIFKGTDGNFQGLTYELISEVAGRMGLKVEITNINFAALVPAIQSQRIDIGLGSLVDSAAREEQLDFVDYTTTKTVLMGLPSLLTEIKTIDDMCGRSAATPAGATSEQVLRAKSKDCETQGKKPINITVVPSPNEAQLQVENGRSDVFLQAIGTAKWLQQSNQKLKMLAQPFLAEYHGAAVGKRSPELSKALMAGFAAIMKDGTYAKILKKYDLQEFSLNAPVLNGATTTKLEQ